MIELVVSGGQTGADLAGWKAAKASGILCSGWMPKHYAAEDRNHPEYANLYGALEHPSPDYPPRTRANLEMADMTLLFGNPSSPGSNLVLRIAKEIDHPVLRIRSQDDHTPVLTAQFIRNWSEGVQILNIAGNRESSAPGIGAWVEAYLMEVFRLLKESS